MSDQQFSYRGAITGPRWGSFPLYLRKECFIRKLKLNIGVQKHFIRETVLFEITGDKNQVESLVAQIGIDVGLYNEA